MAADLAAFVTHKQLHTSQAFSNTQSAWALLSAETGGCSLEVACLKGHTHCVPVHALIKQQVCCAVLPGRVSTCMQKH